MSPQAILGLLFVGCVVAVFIFLMSQCGVDLTCWFDLFKDLFSGLFGLLGDLFSPLGDWLGDTFGGVFSDIGGAFGDVTGGISDAGGEIGKIF